MSAQTTLAQPRDYALAWGEHTGSDRTYVESELKNHPIPKGVRAPIYNRDEHKVDGGWRSAVEIQNPSAIAGMRRALAKRGLHAAEDIEAAWDRTNRRLDAEAVVSACVQTALRRAWDDGAETKVDFSRAVRAGLETLERNIAVANHLDSQES